MMILPGVIYLPWKLIILWINGYPIDPQFALQFNLGMRVMVRVAEPFTGCGELSMSLKLLLTALLASKLPHPLP